MYSVIVAESINGIVYLRGNAKRFTRDPSKAYAYKDAAQKALRKAQDRFGDIVRNIHIEQFDSYAALRTLRRS
jgi:ribosomal protein S11